MGRFCHLRFPTYGPAFNFHSGRWVAVSEFLSQLKRLNRRCIFKSTKFIDLVKKLPEIHAKGFKILEKFYHTNKLAEFTGLSGQVT